MDEAKKTSSKLPTKEPLMTANEIWQILMSLPWEFDLELAIIIIISLIVFRNQRL